MKFVFIQKEVLVAERNLSHSVISLNGFDFAVFENLNVYYSHSSKAVKTERVEGNDYYLIRNGEYIRLRHADNNEVFLEFMERIWDQFIGETLPHIEKVLSNPEEFKRETQARIDLKKESAEKARLERGQKQKERELAERERVEKEKAYFKAGEYVDWDIFEELCTDFGIKIPIRTAGWGRKQVTEISKGAIKSYSSSNAIWGIMRSLNQAIG